ncbi:MAG TPA: hypothetical protein VFC84_14710 [Desulfosporosinus sp.]|nr:hypothetical protein [Desulfosporosinus sp.]
MEDCQTELEHERIILELKLILAKGKADNEFYAAHPEKTRPVFISKKLPIHEQAEYDRSLLALKLSFARHDERTARYAAQDKQKPERALRSQDIGIRIKGKHGGQLPWQK